MPEQARKPPPFLDRARQCLAELGIRDGADGGRGFRPLYRFLCDMAPDRKALLELRLFLRTEEGRRKRAERAIDAVRQRIERLLADPCGFTRNQILHACKEMARITTYDGD